MSTTVEVEEQVLPLEITEKTITIENLFTDHLNKMRFDLAIQRGNVWTLKQKSLFIHTILVGYRFPEVYAQSFEGQWFVLDGKQRLTAVFDFLNGIYELESDTPDVYGEKVADADFASLPQNLKRKFNSTVFRLVFFENMTLDQRDEMFYRLNNGTKLSALEKNRSKYSAVLGDLEKISKLPFFSNMVNFSKRAREGLADQELVYSLSLLLDKDKKHNGLGSLKLEKYIDELKAENRSINMELLESIALYLEEAFKDFSITDYKRSLKRADVVAIFLVSKRCVVDGIEPERFGAFVKEFFSKLDKTGMYAQTRKAGSTKKENINKRVTLLDKAFVGWLVQDSLKDSKNQDAAPQGENIEENVGKELHIHEQPSDESLLMASSEDLGKEELTKGSQPHASLKTDIKKEVENTKVTPAKASTKTGRSNELGKTKEAAPKASAKKENKKQDGKTATTNKGPKTSNKVPTA